MYVKRPMDVQRDLYMYVKRPMDVQRDLYMSKRGEDIADTSAHMASCETTVKRGERDLWMCKETWICQVTDM